MKDWTDDLETHVEEWSDRLEKSGRGWWPKYVYHFTELSNAAEILNDGELLSRAVCEREGRMRNDNANPEVIAQTRDEHLRFVRLYFRPRTPTLWWVEGIRHPNRRSRGHCPVPVYFLFDFVQTIARDDASFSRGTLASHAHGYSNRREYFRSINFEDVYHDEGLGMGQSLRKRQVIRARQAEVIIPEGLPIGRELRGLCCRTPAERRTLLERLNPAVRRRWEDRVRVGFNKMFFRRHPHVQTVSGSEDIITVELSKPSPRALNFEFELRLTPRTDRIQASGELSRGNKSYRFRLTRSVSAGHLFFELDGCRAFDAPVVLADLPT